MNVPQIEAKLGELAQKHHEHRQQMIFIEGQLAVWNEILVQAQKNAGEAAARQDAAIEEGPWTKQS